MFFRKAKRIKALEGKLFNANLEIENLRFLLSGKNSPPIIALREKQTRVIHLEKVFPPWLDEEIVKRDIARELSEALIEEMYFISTPFENIDIGRGEYRKMKGTITVVKK